MPGDFRHGSQFPGGKGIRRHRAAVPVDLGEHGLAVHLFPKQLPGCRDQTFLRGKITRRGFVRGKIGMLEPASGRLHRLAEALGNQLVAGLQRGSGGERRRLAGRGDKEREELRLLEQNAEITQAVAAREVIPTEQNLRRFGAGQGATFRQIGVRITPGNFLGQSHGRLRGGGENFEVCILVLGSVIEQEPRFGRRIIGRNNGAGFHPGLILPPPWLVRTPPRAEVLGLTRRTPSQHFDGDALFVQGAQEGFHNRGQIGNAGHDDALALAGYSRNLRLGQPHVIGIAQSVLGQNIDVFGIKFSECIPALLITGTCLDHSR